MLPNRIHYMWSYFLLDSLCVGPAHFIISSRGLVHIVHIFHAYVFTVYCTDNMDHQNGMFILDCCLFGVRSSHDRRHRRNGVSFLDSLLNHSMIIHDIRQCKSQTTGCHVDFFENLWKLPNSLSFNSCKLYVKNCRPKSGTQLVDDFCPILLTLFNHEIPISRRGRVLRSSTLYKCANENDFA